MITLGRILNIFKKYCTYLKWRKRNKLNYTSLFDEDAIDNVWVGESTYGKLNVYCNGANVKLRIGRFCSIGPNVCFVLNADHYLNNISTFPFKVMICNSVKYEAISKGDIIIDDDVWFSCNCTILSGVHIGQGAVIAAGSVVTKDVPPYAIVGGVPAKVIKYRFEPEMIEELLKIDYSKLTKEEIEKHIDELYVELKDKRQLDWMPKK